MGKLTDLELKRAEPGDQPYKLSGDLGAGLPGRLVCRIEPSGTKHLFFRYRADKTDRLIHLGHYDPRGAPHGETLKSAAEKARAHAERLRTTPDLKEALELEQRQQQAERRTRLADSREAERFTLRKLLAEYVDDLDARGKRRTAANVRNLFRKHVLDAHPALAEAPASLIAATDITNMIRAVFKTGKHRTAGTLRSYLSAAFALAIHAETDPTKPAASAGFKLSGNVAAATKTISGVANRTRTLNDAELRAYMAHIEELPDAQHDALMLALMLGGQRPAQLIRARVDDVERDEAVLRLLDPKGKRKQSREHWLPLSKGAQAIVKRRKAAAEALDSTYLFTSDGKVPMRIETLSQAVRGISRKMVQEKETKQSFQLRDTRRTAETMLAALGVTKDIRAQLLSHGISGVQATHYDRYEYMKEKKAALAKWEKRLAKIRAAPAR